MVYIYKIWTLMDIHLFTSMVVTMGVIVIAAITDAQIHYYEIFAILAVAIPTAVLTIIKIRSVWLDIKIKEEELMKLQNENKQNNETTS